MSGPIGWRDHIGTYRRMVEMLSHRRPRGPVGSYELATDYGSVAQIITRQLPTPVHTGNGTRTRAIESRGGIVGAQSRSGVATGYVGSAAAQPGSYIRIITMQPPGTKGKPRRGTMTTPTSKKKTWELGR